MGVICTYGLYKTGKGIREQKYATTSARTESRVFRTKNPAPPPPPPPAPPPHKKKPPPPPPPPLLPPHGDGIWKLPKSLPYAGGTARVGMVVVADESNRIESG